MVSIAERLAHAGRERRRKGSDRMLVVLSGGGTAGHINPALALAEVLRQRGCEVHFAGTPGGIEARLVPQAGIPFTAFDAAGFNRSHPLSLVSAVAKIQKSTTAAKKWFNQIKPDVVVGFGGYVSIPIGRAAESRAIPTVIHEQNSVMGMANKYLAKRASAVCVTYLNSAKDVADRQKVHLTGNPVRASVVQATREQGRKRLNIPQAAHLLLIFGGSLGARHINEAVCAMKDELLAFDDWYIVHITGPKELESVKNILKLSPQQELRWQVMGYQDHMGETLAAADVVISRAGATSLAEISARAVPALLVPFPYATNDHQTTNAQAYVDAGCAFMLADSALGTDEFSHKVRTLIQDERVRSAMIEAALKQESSGAANKLADVVIAAASCAPRGYHTKD